MPLQKCLTCIKSSICTKKACRDAKKSMSKWQHRYGRQRHWYSCFTRCKFKIFLTANVLERAKRRYSENLKKGHDEPMSQVIEDIIERDHKDSTEKNHHLKKAEDAIVLDTTYLTIEEVVSQIIELIDKKENEHGD
jgi:cytidylate kinase